jgi:hypothetical protein
MSDTWGPLDQVGDSDNSSSGDSSGSGSDSPQPYPGGLYTDSSQGHIDQSDAPPDLPTTLTQSGTGGGGNLAVDTSALKQFADNLDTIADALGGARQRLNQLQPIRAGGSEFVEAQNLAKKVTGTSGDGGLQQNTVESLTALRTALMDTADGIRQLATKYSTIEEINQKAGSDLNQLIQQAQGDIQKLQAATGGSGPSTGAPPPPSPDSGSGTTG